MVASRLRHDWGLSTILDVPSIALTYCIWGPPATASDSDLQQVMTSSRKHKLQHTAVGQDCSLREEA
eukprot:12401977-Karenia_brevis.AAC.1